MQEREQKGWLRKIEEAAVPRTPYLLTDLDQVVQEAVDFKKLMPRVGIYYAVKSNNDPRIIKKLDNIIEGFDIASLGEFQQLQALGIAANRVVYSNPVKIPQHISSTYRSGVRYYAIDGPNEVAKVAEHAPGATVYLRVKVSDYGSKFPLSSKFGLDPMHAVALASTAEDAGLHVKGITFHVGSQSENPQVWEAAINMAGELIEDLGKADIKIEFLDIGGGFPANYEDLAFTIKDAAKVINRALDEHIPEGVRVFAEPGRYLSANASVMVATVIGREHRGGAEWLYLDVGVFQGLMEPLEISGWSYPIFTKKHARGYKKSFVLTGPTCDAYDTISLDYVLPSDINVGDQLYIGATGAYSLVYASNFNGFAPPKTYYVKHKRKG
ncbi:MAG TPA: type III PLP-dependent enzyme [Bacillota bacterium]|nr:type III PLP-dependent enzyme [Bacillota bacterium]